MTKGIDTSSKYKLVLGLEIHMHVRCVSKMFCSCSADIYSTEPNSHVCPTCLGLPGALPVPNVGAIIKTQQLGLALNCRINQNSKFDRKHYFYPDLPKGYQISQYKEPFCENGYLDLADGQRIDIERIHLEEDTAKSIHEKGKTLIDFNKSGMALIELVTRPSFSSALQAVEFARLLRDTVRYLGISEADMEKGQLRIEPNISVRTAEMEYVQELPSYKVEVKNINSFKYMEKAVNYEFDRQVALLEKGAVPLQENRGWDEKKQITVAQRSKEDAHDYRYFPEPDIPPMYFDSSYIEDLKQNMPEVPYRIAERLVRQYSLDIKTSEAFSTYPGLEILSKFEEICTLNLDPRTAANLLLNRLDYRDLSPEDFVQKYKEENDKLGDEGALTLIVEAIIKANPRAISDYRSGKESSVQFLVGQVMRETKGKADPSITHKIIKESLDG